MRLGPAPRVVVALLPLLLLIVGAVDYDIERTGFVEEDANRIPHKDDRINELNDYDGGRNYTSLFDDSDEDGYTSQMVYHPPVPKKDPIMSGDLKTEPSFTTQLTVGYLTVTKGKLKEKQGLAISGALTMALDEINGDPSILPNVELVMRWNETQGDTVLATRAMTDMICEGVSAFFGPEGTCYVEAIVAQSRNIPMISYKCSDYKVSEVPTFARTEPPDTQVTKSVISLLNYYDWKKFTIIYEDEWKTVAKSLVTEAKHRNMTINDIKTTHSRLTCCEENLPCCQSTFSFQMLQETKNRTRIYVFLGAPNSLMDLMNTMYTAQLFDKGEYMVIYVDMITYTEKEAAKYLWNPTIYNKYASCLEHQPNFEKRARSLLVIVPTAPTDNYEEFTKNVRMYNSKEPFNFETPKVLRKFNYNKFVSIYAAHLYDSVKLYANALHTLLKNETELNETVIKEVASNGAKIIETIIQAGSYKSITGATMQLDRYGDSEGNFSVLALTRASNPMVRPNFSCALQMRPVGQFQQATSLPIYHPYVKIEWPGEHKPNDEPSCGFNNELCKKSDTHLNSIIAAGTLAIVLFCAGVITMSIYRKWKIEQEIEGLLWKIDRNDIHSYFERDIIASPSRISLVSVSATSYESRGGAQVFATTAQHRGVVVRIKELTFSRKRDISRDVMKEMRLLRELRHDNINSFIGACVEPMSILLVTDYCAKGSLYDIIENEDIKLDRMFIASLVHDLIKGMLYLHNSMILCHGNLKSSNCVVTSRWVLQVTDFGLAEMRHYAENDSIGEHQHYRSLFWKAPEQLRSPTEYMRGSQKGDVYSFAIVLYEIIGRKGPFGTTGHEPKDIIELVKHYPSDGEEPFRPDLELLLDSENGCDDYVLQCIKDCWSEKPDDRPDFCDIRTRLKKMKNGKSRNIMDQMMELMVKYSDNLEELVSERTQLLAEEKLKTEDLLHRMLPKPVAERLTMGYGVEPEWFDLVTIYFSDIVGFTAMSAESTPLQVVNFLNDLYTVFDRIIKGYDVYKVETIGDAYMVVSGLPIRNGDHHAGEIASMALDLLSAVKNHSISHRPKETLKLRIGIHTGPVVAGVVGLTMPRYCLFGDTVNTASRMESNGEPLKIHISPQCRDALEKLGGYDIEERGLVNMKGKGEVRTYWLLNANEDAVQRREVDLGELPPLFCRPRRSPKLNMGSRQASFCGMMAGFGGAGITSRRHSSVPRDTYCCDRGENCVQGNSIEVESTSTLYNASPVPSRLHKLNRNVLQLPDAGSKMTVNSTFGSQVLSPADVENKRGLRPRRVLSSIASSSDEHHKSHTAVNKVRESKSLDVLPVKRTRYKDLSELLLPMMNRSTRSLENCDKCGEIQIIALPEDKLINNNFPNGNVVTHDDAEMPLLHKVTSSAVDKATIVHRRKPGTNDDGFEEQTSKRWRSLESVPAVAADDPLNKKIIPRHPIRSWIYGLFNGNGIKSSNQSLRKGGLDYNNLQSEKESIV